MFHYSARPVYLQERASTYKSTSTLPPPTPLKAQDPDNGPQQPPERPPKKAHLKGGDSPPTVTPVTPPRGQTPTSRGATPKPKFPSPPSTPLLMQKRPLPPTPKTPLKELPPPPKDFEDENDDKVRKGSNAETLRWVHHILLPIKRGNLLSGLKMPLCDLKNVHCSPVITNRLGEAKYSL